MLLEKMSKIMMNEQLKRNKSEKRFRNQKKKHYISLADRDMTHRIS